MLAALPTIKFPAQNKHASTKYKEAKYIGLGVFMKRI